MKSELQSAKIVFAAHINIQVMKILEVLKEAEKKITGLKTSWNMSTGNHLHNSAKRKKNIPRH